MSDLQSHVALSRVQTVYAVIQTSPGKPMFPGKEHLVLPTGDVVANQATPVTDSREKADTLDVLNIFQGIASPASVELSMYLRTAGLEAAPQGEALLHALQGKPMQAATGGLSAEATADGTSLSLRAVDGVFPERGVVRVTDGANAELIRYRQVSRQGQLVILSELERGYAGDVPLTFPEGSTVGMASRWYGQTTRRPELTVWIQTDSTLQCVEGCRVTETSIALATSDAVEFRFSLTGRRMWMAGESTLTEDAATGSDTLNVTNIRAFFVGQKVQNTGKNSTPRTIISIDETASTLHLEAGLAEDWSRNDMLSWWLPGGDPIGREVENRDTTMRVAGERGTMLPGSIKLSTPVRFTEEIGDRFPGQGIDDTRACSIDYNVLMRKDAALRLREGFEGREVRYDAEFGVDQGYRLALVAPRMKLTTASVSFQAPTVSLSTSGRLLGTGKGENSVQIILE